MTYTLSDDEGQPCDNFSPPTGFVLWPILNIVIAYLTSSVTKMLIMYSLLFN